MKLLTFNTGLLEVAVGPVRFDPVPKLKARIQALPKNIIDTGADVVCLQEVYRQKDSDMLQQLRKNYPHIYRSPHKNIMKNTGLCIMSKYAFRLVEELDFRASGVEKIVAKGAVKIELTEGPFAGTIVVNSHFPYGGFTSNSQTNWHTIKKRNQNIEYTHRHVGSETQNVLIAGDFNFGPDIAEDNYRNMLSLGYENISNGAITWDVENPLNLMFPLSVSQSIDHIFLNSHFSSMVKKVSSKRVFDTPVDTKKGPLYLSDHFGLLCDIEMK